MNVGVCNSQRERSDRLGHLAQSSSSIQTGQPCRFDTRLVGSMRQITPDNEVLFQLEGALQQFSICQRCWTGFKTPLVQKLLYRSA